MFKKISLFTGVVLIAISASLMVGCKKSSDDTTTPAPTTPTTPAAASIKATINSVAWTATTRWGNTINSIIIAGGSGATGDSIYIGFGPPNSFTFNVQHAAYGEIWIAGTHYTGTGANGNITLTDTANKKMSGTFTIYTTAGKNITDGTFTNVPYN